MLKTSVNSRKPAVSVEELSSVAERQKQQLQQQERVMIAREQRLHYLQQQQRQQLTSSRCNSSTMYENRLRELRASAVRNHQLQHSESCKSALQ